MGFEFDEQDDLIKMLLRGPSKEKRLKDSEREVAFNIPMGYGITRDRLRGEDNRDWTLYVSDHYWVLDIDDHFEFYYNPEHGMGKIEKEQVPEIVLKRIQQSCVEFNSRGQEFKPGGIPYEKDDSTQPISCDVNFEKLEDDLRIGNWFYAQGYNYVTANGKFFEICFPYDEMGREWELWDMRLDDMLDMTASTKTHHYIRSVWDLECFRGVNHDSIILKPFQEDHWDSALWGKQFAAHTEPPMSPHDRSIVRFMRQKVFLHTAYLARKGWYVSEGGRRVSLQSPDNFVSDTRLFSRKFTSPREEREATKIFVENKDCLLSVQEWQKKGYHTAVLNMANRQNPGGGVYGGAGAQEENLFRRTNLFQSMYLFAPYAKDYGLSQIAGRYPLDMNYGGVYSPDVTVFRGLENDGYPLLDEPYQVSVISVPAMNRPALDENGMIEESLVEGVKNKMRTIFEIALLYKHDCLILGAMGCGAFRNPPEHVARLFHELLETEYKDLFKVIVFAVLDDHNSGKEHNRQGNFMPFYEEFNKGKV